LIRSPPPDLQDDFNGDGIFGDDNDALDIMGWIRGNPISVTGSTLQWVFGFDYSINDWPTGSFYHTSPRLFSAPDDLFKLNRPGYIDYIINHIERDRIIVIPSNSGAIHAINDPSASDPSPFGGVGVGQEIWAYVPQVVRDRLKNIRHETNLLADGSVTKADIFALGDQAWQTRAYIGLGGGESAVVSLNLTQTSDFAGCVPNCDPGDHWEFTNNTPGVNNDLGFSTAKNFVIELKDNNDDTQPILVIPGGAWNPSFPSDNNARFLFFVNAETGDLIKKLEVIPLADAGNPTAPGNFVEPVPPPGLPSVPSGIETSTWVDTTGNDLADVIFVGTNSGDVYRIKINGKLADLNIAVAEPLWLSRDVDTIYNHYSVGGPANNGQLDCIGFVSCEARDSKRDRRISTMIPYWHDFNTLNLVVFFNDPFGSDNDNKPDIIHPRGTIIRNLENILRPVVVGVGNANMERVREEDAADPAKQVYGATLLPREMFYDSIRNRQDRILEPDNAIILDHVLYFILFRPSDDPCSGGGESFLAGIDLQTGLDVFVTPDPSQPPPAADSDDDSTENYYSITTEGPATMLANFQTGEIIFSYTDMSGGTPTIKVLKEKFPFPWPINGPIGWIMM